MDGTQTEGERDIVERWAEGIRIELCGDCNGLGQVGAPTMRAPCFKCKGRGEVVVNDCDG